MKTAKNQQPECEICILAGGLSSRMGRDKTRVRIGKHTLLQRVRAIAKQLGYPVRIIRTDAIARSGPIGGIYTAFKRSRAEAIIFMACDMPMVSKEWLERLWREYCITTFKTLKDNGLGESKNAVQGAKTDVASGVLRGGKDPHGKVGQRVTAVFTMEDGRAGFPFIIGGGGAFQALAGQISRNELSLQSLAKALGAKFVRPTGKFKRELVNINTPEDLEEVRKNGSGKI